MDLYLFLTSEFMPKADANGVCVYNVSKELIKKGHKVIVICEGGKGVHRIYDGIDIYEIEPTLFKKLKIKANTSKSKKDIVLFNIFKILRRIYNVITVFRFPNISPLRAKKMYKLLEKINKKEKIDFVVGTFRPYEGIVAIHKFKKKNPTVVSISIYWDIIRSANTFGNKLYRFFDYLCYKSECKMFDVNDKILIPASGKNTYSAPRFDLYKDKIKYFDFPVFSDLVISSCKNSEKIFNNSAINIVYVGRIDSTNRSVAYFLNLIDQINQFVDNKVRVHIVGDFLDFKVYDMYRMKEFITFYGVVPYSDVERYIHSADILLNIGNKITYDMIPSKIFQYFASCKPIINIVRHEQDKSLEYFNKYPEVINIYEYENRVSEDLKKLSSYIFKNDFYRPKYDTIEALYECNKPKYFTDKFLS